MRYLLGWMLVLVTALQATTTVLPSLVHTIEVGWGPLSAGGTPRRTNLGAVQSISIGFPVIPMKVPSEKTPWDVGDSTRR